MKDDLKRIKESCVRLHDNVFKCYYSYGDDRENMLEELKHCNTCKEVVAMVEGTRKYLLEEEECLEDNQIKMVERWLRRWGNLA